jgi:hypothetical protein
MKSIQKLTLKLDPRWGALRGGRKLTNHWHHCRGLVIRSNGEEQSKVETGGNEWRDAFGATSNREFAVLHSLFLGDRYSKRPASRSVCRAGNGIP